MGQMSYGIRGRQTGPVLEIAPYGMISWNLLTKGMPGTPEAGVCAGNYKIKRT